MLTDLEKYFLLFVAYSVIGWCMETIIKSIKAGHFVHRGFLIGPYLPIYGTGVLLATVLLDPFMDNLPLLFGFSILVCGTLEYLTSFILEKIMDFVLINKTVVLKNPKTKFIKKYFKITSIVHIVYVILNIISAFGNCLMILGIIPITLHMIISSIILWNIPSQLLSKSEEMRIVNFWGTIEITSYIVAFLSVVIVIGIVG